MKKTQVGFTLIELMISLTLGLIVTAAAIFLFLTGQRSVAMQKGFAELQDNANFGLNYITKDIRLTNLNVKDAVINDSTLYGGVVLTSKDSTDVVSATKTAADGTTITIQYPNLPVGITIADTLLSQSGSRVATGSANSWTGTSNVNNTSGTALVSDQLVIQYLPQYILDNKNTPTIKVMTKLLEGLIVKEMNYVLINLMGCRWLCSVISSELILIKPIMKVRLWL